MRKGFLQRCLSPVVRMRTSGRFVTGTVFFACPMCFGAEETSLIDGTKLGIVALLLITLAVQGGFVAFFFYLRKRAKRSAELELDAEWSQLQGGSTTS
jgi:NAD/NADP transhydrogenase alpha subunit